MPPYQNTRQVGARYGGWSSRSIWRAVADGRLPKPTYPTGRKRPLWDLAELEQRERDAVKRPRSDETAS
jgi:predicted DNA-binding transcriptional regulator AlpA